jgi:prefoldin subunit 5
MFSIEERFGSDTSHLEKRVEELKRESKHLIEMLNSFKDENTLIEIDCQVHFKVKQAEMSHQ